MRAFPEKASRRFTGLEGANICTAIDISALIIPPGAAVAPPLRTWPCGRADVAGLARTAAARTNADLRARRKPRFLRRRDITIRPPRDIQIPSPWRGWRHNDFHPSSQGSTNNQQSPCSARFSAGAPRGLCDRGTSSSRDTPSRAVPSPTLPRPGRASTRPPPDASSRPRPRPSDGPRPPRPTPARENGPAGS